LYLLDAQPKMGNNCQCQRSQHPVFDELIAEKRDNILPQDAVQIGQVTVAPRVNGPLSARGPVIPAPLNDAVKIETATLADVPTSQDLAEWLKRKGLDTSDWGQGDTKDVSKYWKELKLDEAGLEVWRKGDGSLQPARVTHVLRAKVCSPESYDRGVFLFNTWQQYGDGRKRTRNGLLSEKLTVSEMPIENNLHEVCRRAVEEEEMQRVVEAAMKIGPGSPAPEYDPKILCPLKVVRAVYCDHTIEVEVSKSYPGLLTIYHLYTVDIICTGLPAVDFNTLEFEHPEPGEKTKLKYVHAWVWLGWPQIQRYLFEGSTMKERMRKGAFPSVLSFRAWLERYDLDLDVWGTGIYKSVESLYAELEKEETQLELWGRFDGVPLLMRVVHLLQIKVMSSDARLGGKFLLHKWQQSRKGQFRAMDRLLVKKLSVADLPFTNEKLVEVAAKQVNEMLPCIVDAHFQFPVQDSFFEGLEPTNVEVSRMKFRDHHFDLQESQNYKKMQTMYHLYTIDVHVDGLPLADFTSLDLSKQTAVANGWRWTTWPETLDAVHSRASAFERQAEAHRKTADRCNKTVANLSDRLETLVTSRDPREIQEMRKLIGELQKNLSKTEEVIEASKALPPSMISQLAEKTIISESALETGKVIERGMIPQFNGIEKTRSLISSAASAQSLAAIN